MLFIDTFAYNYYLSLMLIIKELCKSLGVSSRELATRLGVSPPTVSQYISGNPTAETLEAIAKALGVSVGDLFSDSVSHVSGFVKIGGTIHELRSVGDLEEATDKAQRLAEGTDTTE